MTPTEQESVTDQLPVPLDGLIASYLILWPDNGVFNLLVALLDLCINVMNGFTTQHEKK